MARSKWLCLSVLLAALALTGGCARAARDTQGFAITDSATVDTPFDEAWQAVKAVLREKGYDLYTRDKRGVFVAFSSAKRQLLLVPKRTKYTVTLEAQSEASTLVTVETIQQVFGVTLLTYPGWHDRKTTDHAAAQEILDLVQAKCSGTPGETPAS